MLLHVQIQLAILLLFRVIKYSMTSCTLSKASRYQNQSCWPLMERTSVAIPCKWPSSITIIHCRITWYKQSPPFYYIGWYNCIILNKSWKTMHLKYCLKLALFRTIVEEIASRINVQADKKIIQVWNAGLPASLKAYYLVVFKGIKVTWLEM